MRNEFGSGLGEAFMQQTRAQRLEFKNKKGKQVLVNDALMKLQSSYYECGDCTRVSRALLREAEEYITRRLRMLGERQETKAVRLQLKFLEMWRTIVSDEKRRRGVK